MQWPVCSAKLSHGLLLTERGVRGEEMPHRFLVFGSCRVQSVLSLKWKN